MEFLVSSNSSSRDRSPDRAANKATSRNNAPLRRKEPPVSAGGFYLLDGSPIEGDALFPSKIRDVKLESQFSRLGVELGQ